MRYPKAIVLVTINILRMAKVFIGKSNSFVATNTAPAPKHKLWNYQKFNFAEKPLGPYVLKSTRGENMLLKESQVMAV